MSEELTSEQKAVMDELFENAKKAAAVYSTFSAEQVSKVVHKVGEGCAEKSEFYAEWAVRDTGFGSVEDKILKKYAGSKGQLDAWLVGDFVDPQIDHEKKIISFPKPAGTIVGLMPVTNPASTVFALSMMSLFTRNTIILCPHPAAVEVCSHATDLVSQLAEEAGAPKNVVQILRQPTLPLVDAMMGNDNNNLTLAIGGPGMVRAAYSSGRPTIGVGAANVACYVHETADPAVAGPTVVMSSSFDHSLPCTTESVILTDAAVADAMRQSMAAAGGHFLTGEDEQKVRDYCWPEGKMNADIVGKSANWIAEQAGAKVPDGIKSLVIEISEIGYHEPVSREKLWPVLGFKVVNGGVDGAIKDALDMLEIMGKGHSAAVWSEDSEVIAKYCAPLPVCRISINTGNAMGAGGVGTSLPPSLMIGTGYFGGSITGENVSPHFLVQWTRCAYNMESTMKGDIDDAVAALGYKPVVVS
jgi:acyl-CoA reductase-like NAD-dependent aldehyde dehydrogenase